MMIMKPWVIIMGWYYLWKGGNNRMTVLGCGMTTHIEVTRRAMNLMTSNSYYDLLHRNLPAVEAGSFFPDWGYNCAKMGGPSEAAHWPSFYLHAIKHLNVTYQPQMAAFLRGEPLPMSAERRKFESLLAFLFGLVSHGTADITWHSLDHNKQGFIDAFGKRDWNGNYGTAHQIADVGGEFILARSVQLDYIQRSWIVPSDDLAKIYQGMGMSEATTTKITGCMLLGYTAAQAVRIAGRRLAGKFNTDKSPFLLMNFEAYFRGGVNNMASWVAFCWNDLVDYLEGNQQKGFCHLQFPSYDDINLNQPNLPDNKRHYQDDLFKQVDKDHRNGTDIENLINDSSVDTESLDESCKPLPSRIQTVSITPPVSEFAMFGYKVVTSPLTQQKEINHLIISAPYQIHNPSKGYSGLGSVFIYSFKDRKEKLEWELTSPPSYATESRFGVGLATLDANNDGILDLVVSAPSTSFSKDEIHYGAIYIYLNHNNQPDITLRPPQLMLDDVNPKGFLEFGEVITTFDINEDGRLDLIVGSPSYSSKDLEQDGIICVYLNSNESSFSTQPDWCQSHPNKKSHLQFGTSVVYIDTPQLGSGLLVGTPGYHANNELSSTGEIVFIPLRNGHPYTTSVPILTGTQSHMQLGSSLLVSEDRLWLTAPSQPSSKQNWLAGSVHSIPLHQLSLTSQNPITSHLSSHQPGALLGSSLAPSESGLFISEPLADWERGNVYWLPPPANTTTTNPPRCFQFGPERARFGTTLLTAHLDPDHHDLDLILASPHSSHHPKSNLPASPRGQVHLLFDVHRQFNHASPSSYPLSLFLILTLLAT